MVGTEAGHATAGLGSGILSPHELEYLGNIGVSTFQYLTNIIRRSTLQYTVIHLRKGSCKSLSNTQMHSFCAFTNLSVSLSLSHRLISFTGVAHVVEPSCGIWTAKICDAVDLETFGDSLWTKELALASTHQDTHTHTYTPDYTPSCEKL